MKIINKEQLRALYDLPKKKSKLKQLPSIDKHAANYISKSPFVIISTCDRNGNMDVSPRGGANGFVKVLNQNQIIIPDLKGNNRLDNLTNILETGWIGTLFLIPGIDETLRINGTASISKNPAYLDMFHVASNPPKTCIILNVKEAFLHCAKAFMRSKLWVEGSKIKRSEFPSMGQMLKDQLGSKNEVESQEDMLKRYRKDI